MDLTNVPRPLKDAAAREAQRFLKDPATVGGSVVTALAGFGLVTAAQGSALVGLLGLIPGLIAAGSIAVAKAQAAYRVFREAEPQVTPVTAPAIEVESVRVPLTPETAPTVNEPTTEAFPVTDPGQLR